MVGLCGSKFVLYLPLLLYPSLSAFLYLPHLAKPPLLKWHNLLRLPNLHLCILSQQVLFFLTSIKACTSWQDYIFQSPDAWLLSLYNLLLLTLSHYHLIIFPLLLLHFLVFSSCCFVPVPVAVQMVLNTSMAPLKTYPLCGFTRHSVSGLPVSDSYPPVITIITYGCAIPSPFIKLVFLCKCEWETFLFLQMMSIFDRDLCKCLFSGCLSLHNCSVLFLIPVKSILALWMTLHTHMHTRLWNIRHVMGSVTGLKWQNEN